ncbi:putative tail fiber protein [Xanthomonas phage NEB7]|nr:putative tail fiber protein [Xanthomonas phage NEB7]
MIQPDDRVLGGPAGAANKQAIALMENAGILYDTVTAATQLATTAASAAQTAATTASTAASTATAAASTASAAQTAAQSAAQTATAAQTAATTADSKATAAQTQAGAAATTAGSADSKAAAALTAAQSKSTRYDLGTVNVSYSAALALGAGARSVVVPCPGAMVGDAVFVAATGAIPDGYAVGAAQCLVADTIRVSIVHPALVLGANFTIPVKAFALR